MEKFEVGDQVVVDNPVEGKDTWAGPFRAIVRGFHFNSVVVVDGEDNAFCVNPDQLKLTED